MKVFEVTSEYDDEDGRAVKRIEYVTHFNDDICAVIIACRSEFEHTDNSLTGVREVLTVSRVL